MSTFEPALPPDVMAALQRGNKIEAIKLLRKHTGLGLKEAKDQIDAIEMAPTISAPLSAPGEVPASSGRGWLWALLVIAGAIVYYFLRGSR